jgi:hypothetical protein
MLKGVGATVRTPCKAFGTGTRVIVPCAMRVIPLASTTL